MIYQRGVCSNMYVEGVDLVGQGNGPLLHITAHDTLIHHRPDQAV